MKLSYVVTLKSFTTNYTNAEGGPIYSPENSVKQALADLLCDERATVAKALAWLRQNVRSFAQLP